MISNAAISSDTVMVPSWAAMEDPTLAAMIMAVMNGPISRSIVTVTPPPTYSS